MASENSIELDTLTNNGKSFFEDTDKYCFRVSAYQIILDWFDSSINESELSSEVVLDVEEAKFVVEDTVSTTNTKWMDTASETMNWDDATQYCSDNGGRLPTIEELEAEVIKCGGVIGDNNNENNIAYQSCYKNNGFSSNSFWSATNALYVTFDNDSRLNISRYNEYVRCITEENTAGGMPGSGDGPVVIPEDNTNLP